MKKKILMLLLACVLGTSLLAGCGESSEKKDKKAAEETEDEEDEEEPEEESDPEEKEEEPQGLVQELVEVTGDEADEEPFTDNSAYAGYWVNEEENILLSIGFNDDLWMMMENSADGQIIASGNYDFTRQSVNLWDTDGNFYMTLDLSTSGDLLDSQTMTVYKPAMDGSDSRGDMREISFMEGLWVLDGDTNDTLQIIGDVADLYSGTFVHTSSDGTVVEGTVKFETEKNPDDTETYWYNFYTSDGAFWEGYCLPDGPVGDDMYFGQSGEPHYKRAS